MENDILPRSGLLELMEGGSAVNADHCSSRPFLASLGFAFNVANFIAGITIICDQSVTSSVVEGIMEGKTTISLPNTATKTIDEGGRRK